MDSNIAALLGAALSLHAGNIAMIDNKMSKKIYILGAGAIGGLVGARLTQKFGRENVTLVDIDEEHIKAISDKGLRIFDKGRKIPQIETIDINIAAPDRVDKKLMENVILATKSYSNGEALQELQNHIPLLVLQNGYDQRISRFPNAVKGVEFGFASQVKEPGLIYNAVKGKYVLGNSTPFSSAVANWAKLLNKAGIKAEIKPNIDGYLWSKLLINSTLNPISAIKRYSFKKLIETQETRQLFKELYIEGYPIIKRKSEELKQKLGSFLGPPQIVNWIFQHEKLSDYILNKVADKFGEVESSMLQDIRRNRETEIDYINGAIIRLGKEYGIETPKNNRIYDQLKNLEPKC